MTIRDAICTEALTWQSTPWVHRQCLKGPQGGVDCVRVLEGTAKALGLLASDWQPPKYSPEWQWHHNEEELLRILGELGCSPVPLEQRQAGDILAFQYGRVCSHVAILVRATPEYVVHAQRDIGRVVHQRLAGDLLRRLRQAYCFPGVA